MVGKDDKTHTIEVEANSLFDAAYEGVKAWAKLWQWSAGQILEVRAGDQVWHVKGERASEWHRRKPRGSSG